MTCCLCFMDGEDRQRGSADDSLFGKEKKKKQDNDCLENIGEHLSDLYEREPCSGLLCKARLRSEGNHERRKGACLIGRTESGFKQVSCQETSL